MTPLQIPTPAKDQLQALQDLYQTTRRHGCAPRYRSFYWLLSAAGRQAKSRRSCAKVTKSCGAGLNGIWQKELRACTMLPARVLRVK